MDNPKIKDNSRVIRYMTQPMGAKLEIRWLNSDI